MPIAGTLIAESLRIGSVVEGVELMVKRISRADAGDVEAGQPITWTFLDFEVADGNAERWAEALKDALDPSGGWYCDFRTDDETFVVFAGRIFHYRRGDTTARAAVEEYGRSVGVPEAQLDWPQ